MAKAASQPPPEASIYPSYVGDEYWGVGGSYLVDPVTGKRTPINEFEEATAPAQPAPTPEAS